MTLGGMAGQRQITSQPRRSKTTSGCSRCTLRASNTTPTGRCAPLVCTTQLTNKRAIHTQAYGWEQPKWFVPEDQPLEDQIGWRRPGWYDAVREECRAVRKAVGVMDLTAFSKYEIAGADAETYLNRLTTGRIPKGVGRIALNYVLNENARIETEATITKLDEGRYYVITGPMGESRDFDWFVQHIAEDEDVTVTDLSTVNGVIVVVGPNARDLVQACADADMSGDAFTFLTSQEITIAGVAVRALRVGFTGSLGWEFHMPIDQMQPVYDALWAADAAGGHGLKDFGGHALNSLRMEKAYLTRLELTHDIGPRQAGVDFFVKMDTGDFIGRDRVDEQPSGNAWKLVYLEVDADDADCVGGEGVFAIDGSAIGLTTSGAYGFSVEKSLAFAYVDAAHADPGTELSVLILGESQTARVLDGPVFDPNNETLRA